MEEERRLKEEVVLLREQLSALQDRYMALEESVPAVSVSLASSSTVASIETLYREKNAALQKELKQAKRAVKEARAESEVHEKKANKQVAELKLQLSRAEDEASVLRERAMDLQNEVERLRKDLENGGGLGKKTDSFDTEGQFQMLYRETLASLNEERDKRREAAVATRTELQNAREEKEDAKEEAALLRAELDVQKRRAAELDRAYQNDLRIEKEKEAQLELALASLKQSPSTWQEQVEALQRQVEQLREATAGELLREQHERHEADKALLIGKQIAVMEENFELRSKLTDFELMREKLFFALVLALKLNLSLKGITCNSIDATGLWASSAVQKLHFTQWQTLLEGLLEEKKM